MKKVIILFICLCLAGCKKESLVSQLENVKDVKAIQEILPHSSYDENLSLNLSYKETFLDFMNGKKDEWICYEILKSGDIKQYTFTKDKLNVQNIDGTNAYERGIHELTYDEYGYFSYSIDEEPYQIENGIPDYGYIKIDHMSEQCRQAYKKYIEPISYHCNNLWTVNFTNGSLSNLNFNDLFGYLYEMKYAKTLLVDGFEDKVIMLEKWIPSSVFESTILEYFDISKEELRKVAAYDKTKDAYPYFVPNCRPSHFVQPEIYGEVKKIFREGSYLYLEVNATNYLEGVPLAYRHIVGIELLVDGRFKYISNEIVENEDNQIPSYDHFKVPNKFSTC